MSIFSDKLEEFKQVKHEVKALINLFPPSRREEVMFDKWTLKDVVAHLSQWMEDDLHALNNLVQGKKSYWYPDIERFNKEGVDKRKNLSWSVVYDEFITLIKNLEAAYTNLPVKLQESDMWENHEGTPLRSLKVDIEHWSDEHVPSLTQALEKLGTGAN